MTERYTDPKTGFVITSNADSWQVGYKPPRPKPEPEQPQVWGSVGQGALRNNADLNAQTGANNFQQWLDNKEAVIEALTYQHLIENPNL